MRAGDLRPARAALAAVSVATGCVTAWVVARNVLRRRDHSWSLHGADGQIAIRRDDAGVPHVNAESYADALRGLGYCHGRDRGLQLVLTRLIGAGRGAEVLGAKDELVELDTLFRRLDLGRGACEQIDLLAPEHRRQVESYCAGVSAALARRRPWELALLRHTPEPWQPVDCVLLARLIGYAGLAQMQGDTESMIVELLQAGIDEALLRELLPLGLEGLDSDLVRDVRLGSRFLPAAAGLPSLAASNAWAVAGERTRDGSALLAGDPHLQIDRLPALFYEAVLDRGERWCAGATVPGLPAVLVGRSDDVAWGLTYGCGDAIDSWVEQCRDGAFARDVDGERRWIAFHRREEVIGRRGAEPRNVTVFENEHGVLDGDPREAGRYLSTRWAAGEQTGAASLAAMLQLPDTRDVEEAAGLLRTVEFSFNWVLADRDAAIAQQMSGRIPLRRRDSGLVALAGWDPDNDWQGFVAPEDLPRREHPSAGFVVSANEDINDLGNVAVITLPHAPYRARRLAELLGARSDWTAAELERMQIDVVSPQARRYIEVLRPLFEHDPRFEAIAAWDCAYDDDSTAAAWFETFYLALVEDALVMACGEVGSFIVAETGLVAGHFGQLDEVLLRSDSAWHGADGRDACLRRAAERAFAADPSTLAEHQPLVMGNLMLHGIIPPWLGFDHRPGALRGGRATIHQGQRVRMSGRDLCAGPCYRMVTDLAASSLRTALAGGPSDRRFSRWYVSGVADWWSGRSKTLAR
ncbi:MAG: penicillin acylase family protein [Solirubrobacteraceae bacterium]